MFKNESGDWTRYRRLPNLMEVDFHDSERGRRHVPYYEAMDHVWIRALDAIKTAHEQGQQYVLFTHGWSTSRPGKTTARSQVRSLMRSRDATPYIIRKESVQHDSVFVAAIRPKRNAQPR